MALGPSRFSILAACALALALAEPATGARPSPLLAETPLKMVFRQKYPGNGMTDPTRALMTSFVGGDEIIVEKPFP